MLEGLTIIIATIIVLGVVIITTSRDDSFLMVSGMMIASFGATALYWVAKNWPHISGGIRQLDGCTSRLPACLNGWAMRGSEPPRYYGY